MLVLDRLHDGSGPLGTINCQPVLKGIGRFERCEFDRALSATCLLVADRGMAISDGLAVSPAWPAPCVAMLLATSRVLSHVVRACRDDLVVQSHMLL
jgi:hypothetical protein